MKAYNRVMAGRQSAHADLCFQEGFIGVDYGITGDLSVKLADNWKDFNREYIPVYLSKFPQKSKIAAGLACGFLWTVAKGLKEGDIVITPDGAGGYRSGEIVGPYRYSPEEVLPHRRPVRWNPAAFDRSAMSEALQRSTNSTGTCCDISAYAAELEKLIGGQSGPADILAMSKDGKELLVVELKKGRASDAVLGQIQRYMGYILDELAEDGQSVKGVIIALEDDIRLKRALRVAQGIDFYRYQVNFTLIPGNK